MLDITFLIVLSLLSISHASGLACIIGGDFVLVNIEPMVRKVL